MSLALNKNATSGQTAFMVFMIITVLSVSGAILIENILPLCLPLVLVGGFFFCQKPLWIFGALFFTIPLSFEYYGVISTDLPSEPLMLLTALWVLLLLFTQSQLFNGKWFIHPISVLLFVWIAWMISITPLSEIIMRSIKQIVAKGWYILAFFIGPLLVLRKHEYFRKCMLWMFLALTGICVFVMIRHAATGFAFAAINPVLPESYRNHVVYSAIIVVLIPYVYYLSAASSKKSLWLALFAFLALSLFFAYTRAAYIAFIASIIWFVVMRLKLVRLAIPVGMVGAVVLLTFFIQEDRYLDFAPEYSKTITHNDFGNLLEATTQGQDISSMERVYRWVAGYHMAKKKPWYGYGPNNFPVLYKPYALNGFRTYVSRNEEGSGMHCYYFTLIVEQGIPGVLIFIVLNIVFFLYAERVYHRLQDVRERALVVSASMSMMAIAVLHTLNELLEVDKVGPFFFLALSIVVYYDIKSRTYSDNSTAPGI